MKQYVIGDIHGCFATFDTMLNNIGLNPSDELILLGDYIDRGPSSIKVIHKIMELKDSGYNLVCLTGNHEQMMLDAMNGGNKSLWLGNGGQAVLNELFIEKVSDIPTEFKTFLEGLKFYHESNDFIFVHAGLEFGLFTEDPYEDKSSLVWTRKWEGSTKMRKWLGDRKVVYGHTPQTVNDINKRYDNFSDKPLLNIDSGCVFNYDGYNHLCCYDLTEHKLIFQKNCE